MNVAREQERIARLKHGIATTERYIDEIKDVIFVLEDDEDGNPEVHPMDALTQNLAELKSMLQAYYEAANNVKYLRGNADMSVTTADMLQATPQAQHPAHPGHAYALERIAASRQSGREYQREYQRVAEAQREVHRGINAVRLPPPPGSPFQYPRHIPPELRLKIHSYGYGAPARAAAAARVHEAQGARARAAVLC